MRQLEEPKGGDRMKNRTPPQPRSVGRVKLVSVSASVSASLPPEPEAVTVIDEPVTPPPMARPGNRSQFALLAVLLFALGLGLGAGLHAFWPDAVADAKPMPLEPVAAEPLPLPPVLEKPPEPPPIEVKASITEPTSMPAQDIIMRGKAYKPDTELERKMLERARKELASGRPESSLNILFALERRFPFGLLLEDREALAIQILVVLDRRKEADDRLKRFAAQFPLSSHLSAMEKALTVEKPAEEL